MYPHLILGLLILGLCGEEVAAKSRDVMMALYPTDQREWTSALGTLAEHKANVTSISVMPYELNGLTGRIQYQRGGHLAELQVEQLKAMGFQVHALVAAAAGGVYLSNDPSLRPAFYEDMMNLTKTMGYVGFNFDVEVPGRKDPLGFGWLDVMNGLATRLHTVAVSVSMWVFACGTRVYMDVDCPMWRTSLVDEVYTYATYTGNPKRFDANVAVAAMELGGDMYRVGVESNGILCGKDMRPLRYVMSKNITSLVVFDNPWALSQACYDNLGWFLNPAPEDVMEAARLGPLMDKELARLGPLLDKEVKTPLIRDNATASFSLQRIQRG